jgi:DNA-binding beta-propeller fold protein YncE
MKTKVPETKFESAYAAGGQLFSKIAYVGAVILISATASAQNLFVSGSTCGGETPDDAVCGDVFRFTWDGQHSIFASGFNLPGDVTFDNAGNLFVIDCAECWTRFAHWVIYKIDRSGVRTTFASGLNAPSYLTSDNAGSLFVADYNQGIVYKYNSGRRSTFASGLYHPIGLACDAAGNLFVADNNMGNVYQGSIYRYAPDGSRTTMAVLDSSDRPADLAVDNMGNLFMADFSGRIYKYYLQGILGRHPRTTFGSVPNSAQSLAFDNAGNLFVLDPGGVNGGSMIYKFTTQAVRSPFASGPTLGESFAHLAFQPLACCQ